MSHKGRASRNPGIPKPPDKRRSINPNAFSGDFTWDYVNKRVRLKTNECN